MASNRPWSLEAFLDSLVLELDKVRDTLAIKAVNQPLSYAVKDLSLDLQLFPQFDGDEVKFQTAKPGEEGASKLSIQLGSITDAQIRQTSRKPTSPKDISIEEVEDIDESTKKSLRKMGVTSVKDLEKIEKKNIDLRKVGNKAKTNYNKLATVINKARRQQSPPTVNRLDINPDRNQLRLQGQNLSIQQSFSTLGANK